MKLLRANKDRWVFQLSSREKTVLLDLLRRYPLVPTAHYRLSRGGLGAAADPESQRLLEEAMTEQRAQNCRHVHALLNNPQRLRRLQTGWSLTLSHGDFEWLLQVLNDVRVGSWLALGAPDEGSKDLAVTEATAPHLWAMELSGLFQMAFLHAVENPSRASDRQG